MIRTSDAFLLNASWHDEPGDLADALDAANDHDADKNREDDAKQPTLAATSARDRLGVADAHAWCLSITRLQIILLASGPRTGRCPLPSHAPAPAPAPPGGSDRKKKGRHAE